MEEEMRGNPGCLYMDAFSPLDTPRPSKRNPEKSAACLSGIIAASSARTGFRAVRPGNSVSRGRVSLGTFFTRVKKVPRAAGTRRPKTSLLIRNRFVTAAELLRDRESYYYGDLPTQLPGSIPSIP